MEHERDRTRIEATEAERWPTDADLANLYGLGSADGTYPMLVEPWEDEAWDEDSELDPQIYAALLRLSP